MRTTPAKVAIAIKTWILLILVLSRSQCEYSSFQLQPLIRARSWYAPGLALHPILAFLHIASPIREIFDAVEVATKCGRWGSDVIPWVEIISPIRTNLRMVGPTTRHKAVGEIRAVLSEHHRWACLAPCCGCIKLRAHRFLTIAELPYKLSQLITALQRMVIPPWNSTFA